jgi:hypothetical protein
MICCLQEVYFINKDVTRMKVKIWQKIFFTNENQKKVAVNTIQ